MKGRRIAIHPHQDIRVEEFDVPRPAAPDEFLLRVHYSLISPGTELSGYNNPNRTDISYPGYTAVGEIIKVGPGTDEDLTGRLVYVFPALKDTNGCHASHKLLKAGGLAAPVPEGLDPRKACFARMVNIALTPYVNAAPKTAGAVLVLGLGLVGNTIAQVGCLRGFYTIGADPEPDRRKRAKQAGIDALIDPSTEDLVERVRELTGGFGANLTVNATGRADSFPTAVEATARGGEVSTLGGARGEAHGDLAPFVRRIHSQHITLRGGWEMLLPLRSSPALRTASTEENIRNAFRWLASGAVKLDPVWTHIIRPEEFKTAYDALSAHDPEYLGVVVDWTD